MSLLYVNNGFGLFVERSTPEAKDGRPVIAAVSSPAGFLGVSMDIQRYTLHETKYWVLKLTWVNLKNENTHIVLETPILKFTYQN